MLSASIGCGARWIARGRITRVPRTRQLLSTVSVSSVSECNGLIRHFFAWLTRVLLPGCFLTYATACLDRPNPVRVCIRSWDISTTRSICSRKAASHIGFGLAAASNFRFAHRLLGPDGLGHFAYFSKPHIHHSRLRPGLSCRMLDVPCRTIVQSLLSLICAASTRSGNCLTNSNSRLIRTARRHQELEYVA